jgi:hypothetical protein
MAGFAVGLRNSRANAITTQAGNGARLRIYTGTKPATGAAATGTLLGELVCGSPFAPAAANGVLTASAIANDSEADASGTAGWFRLVQSNGSTHVMDGTAGGSGSGAELILANANIVAGGVISVTSFVVTEGNA